MVETDVLNQKPHTKTVTYVFADGSKSVIEVEDKFADFIEVSRREEENYERKSRYWCRIRLDESSYEGKWFEDQESSPSEALERELEQERVDDFFKTLTEVQRRRLSLRMDDPDLSLREIARIENCDIKTIRECFEAIKKKYNKFFNTSK